MSLFQSYLIVGSSDKRRIQTETLANNLGIDLKKVSPDFLKISPQKTLPRQLSKSISIDQIRALKEHIFQKPIFARFKFIIIEDAQKLTPEAQNALLKILEEPPTSAIIVLEADNKFSLLGTILSRVVLITTIDTNNALGVRPLLGVEPLKKEDLIWALEKIAQVEEPIVWLDDQIRILYQNLKGKVKGQNLSQIPFDYLTSTLEELYQAKKMCQANVNPRFVLANLVFSLNSACP